MVAFKKSIALAAFAVAGVNANGCTECCSSSTGKNEVIPDANENEDSNSDMVEKPTKPDSGVADAPVVEQTKCQEAKEKAQEKFHSLEAKAAAEWKSMTVAAKARYGNFADFVAEKRAQAGNKISKTTAAAGTKIANTFPQTTEATNTAFRKVSGAVTAATEKVADLQENFPKTKTTIYALTVVSSVAAVAHKFGFDAKVKEASKALYNKIPADYRTAVETFISQKSTACTGFCASSWSVVANGTAEAFTALSQTKVATETVRLGKEAINLGDKYVAKPLVGATEWTVTKVGNSADVVGKFTQKQMEVITTLTKDQWNKVPSGAAAGEYIRNLVSKKQESA